MSKVLPFIVGIIIGFGVMFIIQLLRKKKGAGSTNRILGFSYSTNTSLLLDFLARVQEIVIPKVQGPICSLLYAEELDLDKLDDFSDMQMPCNEITTQIDIEKAKLKNEIDANESVKINETKINEIADLLYTELDSLKDKIVKRFCKDEDSTISSVQLKELIKETRAGFCDGFDTTPKKIADILKENGFNIEFDSEAIINMATNAITKRGPTDTGEKSAE